MLFQVRFCLTNNKDKNVKNKLNKKEINKNLKINKYLTKITNKLKNVYCYKTFKKNNKIIYKLRSIIQTYKKRNPNQNHYYSHHLKF